MKRLSVVVGGQFGSEAKGHVTQQIIKKEPWESTFNVRVAGPNAGHCAIDKQDVKWALRQVPVGVTTGDGFLGIAPGSEIDLPVLLEEVDSLNYAGHNASGRLIVDPEATMLYEEHKFEERGMQDRLGSTAKGIGAARAQRIMRHANRLQDDHNAMAALKKRGVSVQPLKLVYPMFNHIVIEGTQGYGLGLRAGYYPQCTSSDCRAIDFLSMAGISPWAAEDVAVWVVARVFPIRVAGNSGPLKGETSWDELNLPEEHTTVTKKVRRVGAWDGDLVRQAVAENGGHPVARVALTMVDQEVPAVRGVTNLDLIRGAKTRAQVDALIERVEHDSHADVAMITTSDRTAIWL